MFKSGTLLCAAVLATATPALGDTITLDFETDSSGNPLLPGQVIDDEYAGYGVTITAEHPKDPSLNFAVIQDSSNPPPGDEDQATPGYGPGNDTALGNILTVPGDGTDANNDGLIDDTESQPYSPGAKVFIGFDSVYNNGSVTVVDDDADEVAGYIALTLAGSEVAFYDITPLGDNSVQTISFATDFDAIEVFLGGSGALGEVTAGTSQAVPTPSAVAGGLAGLGLLAARRRRAQA